MPCSPIDTTKRKLFSREWTIKQKAKHALGNIEMEKKTSSVESECTVTTTSSTDEVKVLSVI